mgnify:CR=1 FL=1
MITSKAKTKVSFAFYDSSNSSIYNASFEIEPDVQYDIPSIDEDISLTDDKVSGMRGTVSQILRQVTFGSSSVGESISIVLKNSQQT